ncbi:MAG: hypothetical protein Q7J42_11725 [Sulfuritalea sp.]|nr:hypothetical protein [Sulfuritalea sp.]
MARLSAALLALVFATGSVAVTPAWADRGGSRFDRGRPVYQSGHQSRHQPPALGRRDHRDNGWIVGLGLLAGTAILLSATESRQVAYSTPVQVYSPPPVYSSLPAVLYRGEPAGYPPPVSAYAKPTSQWWYYCAQPAGYYPHVQQCSAAWTRVSPQPPG